TTAESAPRLSVSAKGEGTGSKPRVPDVPSDDSEEELSWKSSDDEEVEDKETGTGGDEARKSGGESEKKKKKQVTRKREVLTRFLKHLKIVKRKAMMRRSRNQDLVRRQEYKKKKT
nr:hypothetical protein [Tanacetum cinerariifolium]